MLLKVIVFPIILLLALQNEVSADKVIEMQGLERRQTIEITGKPTGNYHINLIETGDDGERGDIPLHISMRIFDSNIVLNNMVNGEYGREERHYYNWNVGWNVDIKKQKILITARKTDFLINVNGKRYTFNYRMPKKNLEKIKLLEIGGKISVGHVELDAEI